MKNRSKKRRTGDREWISYPRCFLFTLGILFVALPIFVIQDSDDMESWPEWGRPVLIGMLILGVVVIAAGFVGSEKTSESWMNAATQNDASVILLILAAPMYFTLKLALSCITQSNTKSKKPNKSEQATPRKLSD